MKRLLFFIAFMTLGTAALIELLVKEPMGPGRAARAPAQATNVLDMGGVEVQQLVGEQTRWSLQAQHANYNEHTNTGRLQQVRFQVFGPQTGPPQQDTLQGHSDEALLSGEPGNVVLQGAVVLTKGPNLEIQSERMEYDAEQQVVTCPGPTVVHTPQGVQEGTSLRYYVADDRLEFGSPVFYQ
jgi:LPS export ABC transporter protein LptC